MSNHTLDSHVHIWDRTRGETFIAEKVFPVLKGKSFMPDDLVPVLQATHASQAVLVHGPASVAHSLYCLELCAQHDMFRSVIGWVDLRKPDAVTTLQSFSEHADFRGIRLTPMLDKNPQEYLRSDTARQVTQALAHKKQVLEILAPVPLLPAATDLARAVPQVPVVIAHFGLPDGADAAYSGWATAMADLAKLPNTFVKVSGLPLTGNKEFDAEMTQKHLAPLIGWFGCDRLCYASNWPVATALATPRYWYDLLNEFMSRAGLDSAQINSISSQTARSLY